MHLPLPDRDRARRQSAYELIERNARLWPDQAALDFDTRTWTYAELFRAAGSVAAGLQEVGIQAGDRVAAYGRNSDWYVLLWLATQAIGAVHVPINFMLTATEVSFILRDSESSLIIADTELLPVARSAQAEAGVGLGRFDGIDSDGFSVEGAVRTASIFDVSRQSAIASNEDLCQLAYTSGTESAPKGVMLTATSLMAEYVGCIVAGRYEPTDVVVHALPLYHCAQMHCFLMPYLYLGARNIVLKSAHPTEVRNTVEKHRATSFFAAPTVWISLLRSPDFNATALRSLRKGYYGASIMPTEIIRELSRLLPDMGLWNYYGQTELGPLATVLAPEDQLRKPGSAGIPVPNVQTRVVDDEMQDVGVGEVGEIVHRSPQATLGYWKLPEKTAEAYEGGWFHSGDLGIIDEDGYLMIVDRKKDMINSGGENIASREVEETLYLHPSVAEVAVFGIPDDKWIETVFAVIVCKAGAKLNDEEIIAFARAHLAGYKVPKHVAFVETLPKNPSGKVLKRELRARYGVATN